MIGCRLPFSYRGSLVAYLFSIDHQNIGFLEKIAEKGNRQSGLYCIDLPAMGKRNLEKKKITIDLCGSKNKIEFLLDRPLVKSILLCYKNIVNLRNRKVRDTDLWWFLNIENCIGRMYFS